MDITNDQIEKSDSEECHDTHVSPTMTFKRNIFGRQKTCM